LQTLLNNMDQNQLMQLLGMTPGLGGANGGSGGGGGGIDAAESKTSSRPTTTSRR